MVSQVDEAEAEAIKADLPPDVELKHCSVDLPTGSLPPEEPSNLAHKYEVTEPAILTTVVRLHNDDFFFTSDANYRGPTQFTPNLGKVRATCLGGNPQLGPFEDDYSTVIENLEWLQEQIAHPELQERKGLLFPGPPRIKVRHLLFEVRIVRLYLPDTLQFTHHAATSSRQKQRITTTQMVRSHAFY